MAWAKLDDQFHAHRKAKRAWRANRGALGLHLLAMSYCAGQLTDGLVDDEFVEEKIPNPRERKQTADALVAAELWVREDDGWRINDWLDFNPSRDDTLERRRRDAERKARGRGTQSDGTPSGIRSESARTPDGVDAESDGPDPTRPDPTVEKSPSDSRAADLFAYWQQQTGHTAAKPSRDRLSKVKARLSEGYTPEQIRAAIDGAAAQPFVNDSGKVFDDLELICRTGSKLESFIDRATYTPQRPASQISEYEQLQNQRRAASLRVLDQHTDEGQAA